MARSRDYKAEYAARNARARELGFSSYGQQRRAQERQEFRTSIGAAFPRWAQAGFSSEAEYRSTREKAREWGSAHSEKATSAYVPGMTAEQLAAYDKAFLQYGQKHRQKMDALYHYLVDEMEYYTAEEFEELEAYKEI